MKGMGTFFIINKKRVAERRVHGAILNSKAINNRQAVDKMMPAAAAITPLRAGLIQGMALIFGHTGATKKIKRVPGKNKKTAEPKALRD